MMREMSMFMLLTYNLVLISEALIGLSKFHFDAGVFLFKFAHVKTFGCTFLRGK